MGLSLDCLLCWFACCVCFVFRFVCLLVASLLCWAYVGLLYGLSVWCFVLVALCFWCLLLLLAYGVVLVLFSSLVVC